MKAKVLFVGDAPDDGADVLGKPFVGNGGELLDNLIEGAGHLAGYQPKCFLTYLLACKARNFKFTKEQMEACAPRINDLVERIQPRAIIMVGKEAHKWAPKVIDYDFQYSADIDHPNIMHYVDLSQRDYVIQRSVVRIADIFELVM